MTGEPTATEDSRLPSSAYAWRWDRKLNGYTLTSGLLLLLGARGVLTTEYWMAAAPFALLGIGVITRSRLTDGLDFALFLVASVLAVLVGLCVAGYCYAMPWEALIAGMAAAFGAATCLAQAKQAKVQQGEDGIHVPAAVVGLLATFVGLPVLLKAWGGILFAPMLAVGAVAYVVQTSEARWRGRNGMMGRLARTAPRLGWGLAVVVGAAFLFLTTTFLLVLPDRIAIGRILAEAHRVGGREPAGYITDAEWREKCPLLPTSRFNPVWSLGLQAQFPPSWTCDYACIEPHGEVLHFKKADGRWRYYGGEQGWMGEHRGHWRRLPILYWSSNSWW